MNLNQITIASTDLHRSCEFYRLLGLKLIVDSMPRYARFECPSGEATLSLHHVDKPITPFGCTLYFECDNLSESHHRLEREGVAFEHPPKMQSWLWEEARLRDPDGHEIVLFKAGKYRKNPPWRVDEPRTSRT